MTLKIEENVVQKLQNPPIRIKFQRTSGNDYINLHNIKNCRVTLNKLALFSDPKKVKNISGTGEKNLKRYQANQRKSRSRLLKLESS